jgi:hypothetical protein
MIRERANINDFKKIAKENEYFLWHFLMEDQHDTIHGIWSYFDEKIEPNSKEPEIHQVRTLLSMTDVPYYESYVKDSIDFLINLGLEGNELYKLRNPFKGFGISAERRWYYVPLVVGFKRTGMVYSTHQVCYCIEGITEIILRLNPKLLSNAVQTTF